MIFRRYLTIGFFVALTLITSSCSTERHLSKIPKTPFAPEKLEPWGAPFDGLWSNPKIPKEKHYSCLYIAPVNLNYLGTPEKERENAASYKETAKYLAMELQAKLKSKLAENPKVKAKITSDKAKADVTLELAFVRMNPTIVAGSIASVGSSFIVPGVSHLFTAASKGDMAMVGVLTERASGVRICVFGDYKEDKGSLFGSVKDFQKYGHHHQTVDMWASKLAELISKGRHGKVSPAIWMSLSPF